MKAKLNCRSCSFCCSEEEMGFVGMVVSGCGFLFIGLWHASISLAGKPFTPSSSPSRSSITYSCKPPPLFSSAQLISIAALSFLHFVSGLVASHRDKSLTDGLASAVPLERSSVAFVFFIFAVANLLSRHTRILPFPHEMSCLIALFAFGQELLLFYLQRPDAGLESRYYTLLLVPICACMLAVASSMALPKSPLVPLALAGSLFLQGTWLLQMGFSFFTSAYMAKGCDLQMRGEGDYVIKCDDNMALMRGKAVATLQFNCHMALLLIVMLPLYAFTKRHHGLSDPYNLNYEMVATVEAHESKRHGHLVPQPPPSAFSLDLDEDLDDDKSLSEEQNRGANGFHGVAI